MSELSFQSIALAGLWSFGASACFACVFNIQRSDVVWGALSGALGWVLYIVIKAETASDAWGNLAGAFAVAIWSEIFAIIFRRPATSFLVPGILPLVPGGGIFNMMRAVVDGNFDRAASAGYLTLTAAGSIALGIAVASSLSRIVSNFIRKRHLQKLKKAEESVLVFDAFSDE